MTNYYGAKDVDGAWEAEVTDENGATLYRSNSLYDTEAEAVDAAVDWAEENEIDVEMG